MPGKGCKKHTPITSKKQQGKFGAEYARRKAGKRGTMSGITKAELRSHLKESAGKNLPRKAPTGRASTKSKGRGRRGG